MNKLLLNQNQEIKRDGFYFFEGVENHADFEIVVSPRVCAHLFIFASDIEMKMRIVLLQGANVSFQIVGENISIHSNVILKGDNANFHFVQSQISKESTRLHLEIFHRAISTTSHVINHIVHYGRKKSLIQVDIDVPKGIKGCTIKQDNKIILMDDGHAEILPNLFISEFDSFAEHSAYISKFSKEDYFYLQTRGISKHMATNLLKKSFLLGPMELSFLPSEVKANIVEKIGR